MVSSASAVALSFPSSSSSDDSDDSNMLPLPPPTPPAAPKEASSSLQHHHQQERRRQSVERDYNVLMAALARAGDDVDQVVALFGELRRRAAASGPGALPNVLCYNTLLNALVEAGRDDAAHEALDEMLAAGVAPNTSTLNILVKLHVRRSAEFKLDRVYDLISQMQSVGVEPDVGTYSTLITGLCRAGRLGEAWGVLESMTDEGCRPMVHTFTPIVQGYFRERRIKEAMNLMAFMEDVGCPPSVVTYNVLIKALCDAGEFYKVKEILTESRTKKGWKPSTVTYNTYMDGLCKKGMVEEALKLYDTMTGEGLCSTAFTLSIMINCLFQNKMASRAISLLERTTSLNWSARVVAYNTVMSRLRDRGRWRCVLKLMTDMIKKGINPNTRTLNILIDSLCIGEKSSVAMNLVHNQGFTPNVVTYNTLIHWLYYRGKFSEARGLILEMDAAKIHPDEVTYTIRIDGLCKEGNFDEATTHALESLESGLSRDLLPVLINRLVCSYRFKDVQDIFKKMRDEDYIPDYNVFDSTIRSFCRVGYCDPIKIFTLGSILDILLGRIP